ncbi:MAG TPA: LamG-like jellyroll fold domain-containing protein [Verrucomicrobiae bacterium]|nr:LamG-like jellyroll fold domain-containing protein [Verrucomicrobiae bacterium]
MKPNKLCYAASVAVAACLIHTASAQPAGQTNYFWSGNGDSATWDQAANWTTGIVPVNNGTTFQIFIGTGFPTTRPTPINLAVSDNIVLNDQLFGPEWGETLNIYGTVTAGFGFAPVGAMGGPKSTVNMYGTAAYNSKDSIFIGDMFWFAGGPNVDFNMYNNSSISAPFIAVGGHLNAYDSSTIKIMPTNSTGLVGQILTGTPGAGQWGGVSSDTTRWINLAGGKLILNTGNSNYVDTLIGRGIFLCYGKKFDTNEFSITDDGTNTIITVTNSIGTLNSVAVQSSSGVTTLMQGTRQGVVAVGNFANMSAVPLFALDAAQSGGGTVAYQSSDATVATVSSNGVVTAIKPGTASITATYTGSTFGSFSSVNSILITVTPYANSLVHRYSFSESSGTTTADSVGGSAWNGTLNGGATLGGGQVTLDGASGYVQLPAGVVSGMDAITIEAWANFSSATNAFEPLFFFGNQDGVSLNGENYIAMQPYRTGGTAGAIFGAGDPGANNEQDALVSLVTGSVTNYMGNVGVAMVYHPFGGYVSFYTNGVLAANNPNASNPLAATLGADPLNYLGQSLYFTDPFLNATIDEFRIYNGPLTPGQIAADYALGPNQLRGTSTSVSLAVTQSAGNMVFSWSTNSALVDLFASPVLGPGATWTRVTGPLTLSGGNYNLSLPMSGSARFFRLSSPSP